MRERYGLESLEEDMKKKFQGTQRFCVEYKVKLSKIDHVLFTRVCSETTGGLPGILLTLARDLETTVNIWGPSKLQCLMSAMSTFLPNASLLHAHSFGPETLPQGGLIVDEDVVKISGVLLEPCKSDEFYKEPTAVYVCELPELKGRFDPDKAKKLGLNPGAKYGQLQNGMTVQSDDGQRTIHPKDVMERSVPGPIFMIVDCPTLSYVPALVSSAFFQQYYSSECVKCVVHLSPLPVVKEVAYTSWMTMFTHAQHIIAGSHCCKSKTSPPIFKTSALLSTKLNFVCPRFFPFSLSNLGLDNDDASFPENARVIPAYNLLKFQLLPLALSGIDKSTIAEDFNLEAIQKQFTTEMPELLSVKQDVEKLWAETTQEASTIPPCILSSKANDLELVFLGTGSMYPSKHRNVSAIYLDFFERGGMLLDCGEGTLGQLKRRYGQAGADSVIANLKCIWISHIHADHQSGLARILTARKAILKAQKRLHSILVIGPKLLQRYLTAYEKLEALAIDFLDCSQTTIQAESYSSILRDTLALFSYYECTGRRKHSESADPGSHLSSGLDESGRKKLDQVLVELGLKSLRSIPVIHCAHAFGIVIESAGTGGCPGWKFAFSGDTRPCDAFVEAAKGATIFIHEATFDDGLLAEAIEKNHSMTCEAVKAGRAAGAYRVILTHFSQRYPEIPVIDENYNDSTCIAFDMMSVNLVDLPLLPKLVSAMKLVFNKETDERV